jgi:hypothetical protein
MPTNNESSSSSSRPLITAATREGYVLPVIDVTDPRFTVADDPESVRRLIDASVEEEQRRHRVPKFILRWMIKSLARRSRIMRALFDGDATFLDAISTYVMKLGPDHLPPPYDSPADKRVAASPHLVLLRLRTQQVARLLADGLAPELERAPAAPLHLINIAGGTALDTLNALIVLRHRGEALLRRPIVVHVLDQGDAGPFFGRNALAALMQDGAPLAGLDIAFDHRPYDWDDTAALTALLREVNASNAIVAASSEGGLFEYGSDEAITGNLSALRAGGAIAVTGSVTSGDEARRRMIAVSRFKLVPRGLEGFVPLAERGGYKLMRAETNRMGEQVLLAPV